MNNNQFNYNPTTNVAQNSNMSNDVNNMLNNRNNSLNNGMNMNQLPDPGLMRNNSNLPTNVNPELQAVMNKIAEANMLNNSNVNANKKNKEEDESGESGWRFILKNFNIVLIVIIGLAWSDVAKFYINRSIKFGGGNHRYYIYYAVIGTLVLYGTSKYIHHLN